MKFLNKIVVLFAALTLPMAAHAQEANPAAPATEAATTTADAAGESTEAAKGGYTPLDATTVKNIGKPSADNYGFQEQFTENGQYAKSINRGLEIVIILISVFVLGLLFWVVVRYNRRANPVPSKTTHNTVIEVVWTLVPVLILLGIAYPSLDLLAKQFKPASDDAVTVKATGYQWYWTYTYPDHGGFEVVSNMMKEEADVGDGERARTDADGPKLLAVDNRMVVPAGVELRIQTTAADVIHSFAVPSLWFKLDSVPGRLNEKALTITKPGLYFGQCSELCGARHGYMPIAVEALPPAEFAAWVKSQGGEMPAEREAREKTEADAAAKEAAAATAAAPAAEETPDAAEAAPAN